MSVFITAGSSPEAYRLYSLLSKNEVVFSDEVELPQIPGVKTIVLPGHSSANFAHEVLKACLDFNVSHLYPLRSGEVLELSKVRNLFIEYGVRIMLPSHEWLNGVNIKFTSRKENLSILENGNLIAGVQITDNLSLQNETGVFTWETQTKKIEYYLYVVEDAGIQGS